jgi:type II secretory ATPase GspE/PulE/Tfp pilus assembly ATPase PilB-like protein
MPTAFGEKIVMRILDKSAGILSLEELGLRGHGFDIVVNGLAKSHGMTLVTGPTGSGKTTTLYAMIDRLLNVSVNIVTLEDPIEYQIAGINQSQVNSDINYTFANGLRSILRQDPDVVMIGEIRDKETAEMAVNAALTGHIVLSTLHTNDAAGAGPRMIDMGVETFLITSSLNTVVGQRLARKLCKNCQEEAKIADKELEEVKTEIAKMPEVIQKKWQNKKLTFKKGKGCSECNNTGYKGRLGVFEVLEINEEIQELLLQRATASKLNEASIKNGMLTMKQDGIDKALDGITSLEEIWRVTKD